MTRLETTSDTQASADDPFRYGWRYVRREHAVNGELYEQIPLTLEDVLYPEVGDFVVHTKAHEDICNYLLDVFNEHVRENAGAVVLHDVRVAWDVAGLRPNGPDITVFFGVQQQQNWATFDCAIEGVRPALVVEVTSPDTRHQDLGDKLEIYEEAGVGQYLIIDTRHIKGQDRLRLYCYHQGVHGFQQCQQNEQGYFWLEALALWVGIEAQRVVCYTPDGQPVNSYTEVQEQLRQEAQARAQAEVRIRELEAELARLRPRNGA